MTNRRLVYRFVQLPYYEQREIASDMELVSHAEEFGDAQLFQTTFFQRLGKSQYLIDQLKRHFDPNYKPLPPTKTHPCE